MKVIYQKHPVTPEQKVELRSQGYKIIDAAFAPAGYEHPSTRHEQTEEQAKAELEAAAKLEAEAKATVDKTIASTTSGDGLDELDADQLHALAKERGISVHHKAGADKVREALRQTA
ncbi:hypothetical protein ACP6NF_09680 [Alcaligenes faecalis]|uniref:hypothetical protein n=1 Tax=Alcaligenes faecalis TaxID=511 RepID=UPI003F7B3E89